MSKEIPYEQNGDKERLGKRSNQESENKKKIYKEAPGLYREWGMKVVNRVVAKLEDEYPELKTLRHEIKQTWVMSLVIILMEQTEDFQNPITEKQLKFAEDRLDNFIEERIRTFFEGKEELDELLWEQEMRQDDQ